MGERRPEWQIVLTRPIRGRETAPQGLHSLQRSEGSDWSQTLGMENKLLLKYCRRLFLFISLHPPVQRSLLATNSGIGALCDITALRRKNQDVKPS